MATIENAAFESYFSETCLNILRKYSVKGFALRGSQSCFEEDTFN